MSWQHVLYPLVIIGLYLICTMFSQYVSKRPVFPTVLDWTFPDEQRTVATCTFLAILIFGSVALYFLMVFVHAKKALWCRRRSGIVDKKSI